MVKVVWTELSIVDLKEIFEYIADDSIRYATITTNTIYQRVQPLMDNPFIGRIVPEFNEKLIREIMKPILTFFTFFTFFTFLPCAFAQPVNKATVVDVVSMLKNTRDMRLSDIAGDITYIPLETRPVCLLSSDLDLRVAEDLFILLDKGKIFRVFTKEGKYIRDIGSTGQGPGEYLSARQFSIDKKAGEICIASIFSKKMVIYSLDGKFLRDFTFPVRPNYVIKEPSGGYHLGTYRPNIKDSVEYRFSRMDEQGFIVQTFKDTWAMQPKSGAREFQYYTYNSQVWLQNGFSDTIYRYNKGSWAPELFFKLGSFAPPQKFWENPDFQKNNQGRYIERVGFIDRVDNIMLFFNLQQKEYIGMYDKTNQTLTFAEETDTLSNGFINDLDGGPGVKPLWNEDDGDYWYILLQPVDLIEWKEKGYFDREGIKYPDQNRKLKEMIGKLDINANPVIMKVRKKK